MPRVTLHPGERFASEYEVISKLGEGGFGSVWRVRQESTGHERALKILHPEVLIDPASLKRFYEEAKVGARIASEHIVEVHSAGVDQGTPYLVMELLRGETLAERIVRAGPLSWGATLTITTQIVHALDAAHRAGVIHRDLKPENIFLARSRRADASETVKLLDLGIARVISAQRSFVTAGAIGTPEWMSFDQYAGFDATPANDLWALGLVVFTALVGRNYWANPQNILVELDAPRRDPEARAAALGVSLPRGFDGWLSCCLAVNPAARFASAGGALAALHKLADTTAQRPAEARAGVRPLAARPSAVAHDLDAAETLPLIAPPPPMRGSIPAAPPRVVLAGLAPPETPGRHDLALTVPRSPSAPMRRSPPRARRWGLGAVATFLSVTFALGIVLACATVLVLHRLHPDQPMQVDTLMRYLPWPL